MCAFLHAVLIRASLFILSLVFVCFLCILFFVLKSFVVTTSALDCMKSLKSEVMCSVSSGMLNCSY